MMSFDLEPRALLEALRAQRPLAAEALSGALPWGAALDLLATPMSLRAGLLGLRRGAAFTFHERRLRLPIAAGLEPEARVWPHGLETARWQQGALLTPKYYSFFLDAPLPAFHPNHRGKWRAHELLHAAVGFCWRADFSRFEAYRSARLAELLPVIHWYGWDEALRPRCAPHAELDHPPLEECLACERLAARGWRRALEDHTHGELVRAERFIARATAHLKQEWRACLRERDLGSPVETLYANLNASRDAIGYVRSHWRRHTAWSFGAWIERFMRPGLDFCHDLDLYTERVAEVATALTSSDRPDLPPEVSFKQARRRRALSDLGYRLLYVREHARGARQRRRYDEAILPLVDRFAVSLERPEAPLTPLFEALTETQRALPDRLARIVDRAWRGLGHDLFEARSSALELEQIIEGLTTCAETVLFAIHGAERDPVEHLAGFEQSEAFARRGQLGERLVIWLRERGEVELAEVAALEAFLLAMPTRDGMFEAFALKPPLLDEVLSAPSRLRLHATLKRDVFGAAIIEATLEERFDEDPGARVRVMRLVGPNGELHVEACDDALEAIFAEVERGEVDPERASGWCAKALGRALERGALWWM